MIIGLIDQMRFKGAAVESICRVLREQGCQIAARTYRAWRSRRPALRTVADAQTVDVVPPMDRRVCAVGPTDRTPRRRNADGQ